MICDELQLVYSGMSFLRAGLDKRLCCGSRHRWI